MLRTMLCCLFLSLLLPAFAHAQEHDHVRVRMAAVEALLDSRGDEALTSFGVEHVASSYVEELGGKEALHAHLRTLREEVGGVGGVGVSREGARVRLHVSNEDTESVVGFELESSAPYGIVVLELESFGPREPALVFTWDTLERDLEEAARNGFCGSVLAVRDGEIVLDHGFGHADPAKKHPVTSDTLFAIGSTPIDFTHGALLMLEEAGALSLQDTLADHFDGVPADKAGITLQQLRTGGSGLLDFPGIPGVDENMDLSWIDRAEFLRRVFASELLFEPGTRQRHSHAAWGVLAAVIEVVSGQGYEEFLRENFFEPAGMTRTGHYPYAKKFPASEVAVGLGGNVWGEVNAPPYWGETSWLVLGSGGMVSTARDLWRWRTFLASEDGLGPDALAKYGIQGQFAGEGGNDRGFINTLGFQGMEQAVIVCSNSHFGWQDETARVANAAAEVALR